MRFDYLTRFKPLFQGGFRTLWERGAIFSNAHYEYANTETGPGHSVLLTGRNPSHSGIIANAWWDAAQPELGERGGRPRPDAGGRERARGVARQPDRVHRRRRAEEDVARVARGRGRGQGPLGRPHGRPPRGRRLLVRIGPRRLHHEHVLHEQPAALAGGLEPAALSGPLRRQAVDPPPARRGACTAQYAGEDAVAGRVGQQGHHLPPRHPRAARLPRASTTTSAARRSRTR